MSARCCPGAPHPTRTPPLCHLSPSSPPSPVQLDARALLLVAPPLLLACCAAAVAPHVHGGRPGRPRRGLAPLGGQLGSAGDGLTAGRSLGLDGQAARGGRLLGRLVVRLVVREQGGACAGKEGVNAKRRQTKTNPMRKKKVRAPTPGTPITPIDPAMAIIDVQCCQRGRAGRARVGARARARDAFSAGASTFFLFA